MNLAGIIRKMRGSRVLVVGDVTLDRFTVGRATRISPEAPVPIVEVESESYSPGAAANVIRNLNALGGDVLISTVVGDDIEGDHLIKEIGEMGVPTDGIYKGPGRATTLVHRIKAGDQQVLRVDRSRDEEISEDLAGKIVNYVKDSVEDVDVFLISDYGRGVVTRNLVKAMVKVARENNIKVVVNPKRERLSYHEGVDVVRVNRADASLATGVAPINETSMRIMGQKISSSLGCRAVLITWIEGGFHLFEGEKVTFIPPLLRRPLDPTGIGDTISCVLALALAAGANLIDGAKLANYAGAISASKKGLAAVEPEEMLRSVEKGSLEVN